MEANQNLSHSPLTMSTKAPSFCVMCDSLSLCPSDALDCRKNVDELARNPFLRPKEPLVNRDLSPYALAEHKIFM